MGHVICMKTYNGNRLTGKDGYSHASRLAESLEQGGERLKDEAIGLKKLYIKPV